MRKSNRSTGVVVLGVIGVIIALMFFTFAAYYVMTGLGFWPVAAMLCFAVGCIIEWMAYARGVSFFCLKRARLRLEPLTQLTLLELGGLIVMTLLTFAVPGMKIICPVAYLLGSLAMGALCRASSTSDSGVR